MSVLGISAPRGAANSVGADLPVRQGDQSICNGLAMTGLGWLESFAY